ncbi:tyrosine-protein kinase EpsD [Paenibacillus pini JCM 16418]|uniref:non-specific protein-tyrosine kinase n=1 Tax=Paenibacillus pini JCM 16418 TaxID=1236976 RepID=W7YK66_9BACL|nr:tyrosine-protein kinase EpsD [Paenibacillus pini JCM 16418]
MERTSNRNLLVTAANPKSPASEGYRALRTNIQFSTLDKHIRTIMIASAQMNEGKTTTVSNLAVTYAQEGKKVVVIDADLHKPSLHHVFIQPNHVGLTSLLSGQQQLEDVLCKTAIDNLSLITSGPIPPNPSELLGSKYMSELLKQLKDEFDVILFDSSPILAVTDALIVSAYCDGVVLVVHGGKVKKGAVQKAKAQLEHARCGCLVSF